jgi:predicted porin
MSTGFAGNAANLMYRNGNAGDVGQRMNNAVFYTTPQYGPVSAEIAYGFGEVPGNNSASRIYGGSVAYVGGPLSVALAHHNVNNAAGNTNSKNTVITGKYKFGAVGAHLAYAHNTGAAVDSNDLLVGVSVPFDAHTILASYIQKDDQSAAENDAKQYAVAYTYALSTRTNFYVSYAKITNDNAAAFKTNGNFGDREANFGIRHKF